MIFLQSHKFVFETFMGLGDTGPFVTTCNLSKQSSKCLITHLSLSSC